MRPRGEMSIFRRRAIQTKKWCAFSVYFRVRECSMHICVRDWQKQQLSLIRPFPASDDLSGPEPPLFFPDNPGKG